MDTALSQLDKVYKFSLVYKFNFGQFSGKEEKNVAFLSNLCRISFQAPGVKMVDMVTPLVCDRMFGEKGAHFKPKMGQKMKTDWKVRTELLSDTNAKNKTSVKFRKKKTRFGLCAVLNCIIGLFPSK